MIYYIKHHWRLYLTTIALSAAAGVLAALLVHA